MFKWPTNTRERFVDNLICLIFDLLLLFVDRVSTFKHIIEPLEAISLQQQSLYAAYPRRNL